MSRFRNLARAYQVPEPALMPGTVHLEPLCSGSDKVGQASSAAMDHDVAEAAAMAAYYATPAGPDLPHPDPLKSGLLASFRASRGGAP